MQFNKEEIKKLTFIKRFNKEDIKKFTFIKREYLGKCPCCDKEVYNDQLYVEDDKNVYHYSCYNYMKAEDDGING